MTIQKKSLLSSLNTTKKAIVASNSAEEKPNVSAPVSSRARAYVAVHGRVAGKIAGRIAGKVAGRIQGRVASKVAKG